MLLCLNVAYFHVVLEKKSSLFRVPKNSDWRKKWIRSIRDVYPNLDIGENFRVCEKHFCKTDFTSYVADYTGESTVKRRRLKKGAVPSYDILDLDSNIISTKTLLTVLEELRTGIKMETDCEDAVAKRELEVEHGQLQLDILVKPDPEVDELVIKTEAEEDEMTVKLELDVGPTVLIPQTTPRAQVQPTPLNSSRSVRQETATQLFTPSYAEALSYSSVLDTKQLDNNQRVFNNKKNREHSGSEDVSMILDEDSQVVLQAQCGSRTKVAERIITTEEPTLVKELLARALKKRYRCEQNNKNIREHSDSVDMSMILDEESQVVLQAQCGSRTKVAERIITTEEPTLVTGLLARAVKKRHRCEQCEYSASQLCHLKAHMRTHTGAKPYKCDRCTYNTSRLGTLTKHMRIHTGFTVPKFEQCTYSTSRIGRLKIHMCIHTGVKS